jgi:FdhD protein
MPTRPAARTRARIVSVDREGARRTSDYLATEEPLEIRLEASGERRAVAVTMRTPGADFELAAGFLYGEGVVRSRDEIARISYCVDRASGEEQLYNAVNVQLRAGHLPDLAPLERHFQTTSACGVCGKASLDSLRIVAPSDLPAGPRLPAETLLKLPALLRAEQGLFESTGGLHAAALFDITSGAEPKLLALREDVGRHNALDKLVGWALLEGRVPLSGGVVLVSGRASYEIMQKCLAAGVPVVCAISAPSSLAVDIARAYGLTLVGFLRGERFNIYAGEERILTEHSTAASSPPRGSNNARR